jgi:hypothetical protein
MARTPKETAMAHQPAPTYTADDALDLSRDSDHAPCGGSREDLRAWLEKERPHLLRSYDADFLARAFEQARAGAGR